MFTMVITEAFEVLRDGDRAKLLNFVPKYKEIWHRFDPNGTGKISRERLISFVLALPPPVGIGETRSRCWRSFSSARSDDHPSRRTFGRQTDERETARLAAVNRGRRVLAQDTCANECGSRAVPRPACL